MFRVTESAKGIIQELREAPGHSAYSKYLVPLEGDKKRLILTYIQQSVPYGVWTTKSGLEVLFNRSYRPILERLPACGIVSVSRDRWVEDITEQRWFSAGIGPGNASAEELRNMMLAREAFINNADVSCFVVD